MLYKNLLILSCVLNTIHSPRFVDSASTSFTIYASRDTRTCIGGTDECFIHCNIEVKEPDNALSFSCGDVDDCYFECEEKKCMSFGEIDAKSANNLYVTSSDEECLNGATIYTPSNGNATFTITAEKGFKGMNIEAVHSAQNIIVNCDAVISDSKGDDCSEMNINATNANYLQITIANSLIFGKSLVKCPVYSNYNGPNEAPCIIDATNDGIIQSVEVEAQYGIPRDLWVRYIDDYNDESIYDLYVKCRCSDPDATGLCTNIWPNIDECWNTVPPTTNPTMNPINIPIVVSTVLPTKNPTSIAPSVTPTKHPTVNPTTKETNTIINSTQNPSKSPISSQPSVGPTNSPAKLQTTSASKETSTQAENESEAKETTLKIEATTAQQKSNESKDKMMSLSVEIILITIGVLLVMLCICLFLCYWYRTEKFYKEILHDQERAKPLMAPGAAIDQPSVQLFDNNPYDSNFMGSQQMAQQSIYSDTSYGIGAPYKGTDDSLTVPTVVNKRHGESIDGESIHGESVNVKDLDIVEEINRCTKNEDLVGSEGVNKNETNISILEVCDDIDTAFSKNATQGFIE